MQGTKLASLQLYLDKRAQAFEEGAARRALFLKWPLPSVNPREHNDASPLSSAPQQLASEGSTRCHSADDRGISRDCTSVGITSLTSLPRYFMSSANELSSATSSSAVRPSSLNMVLCQHAVFVAGTAGTHDGWL